MPIDREFHGVEWYAEDFIKQLGLDTRVEQMCEWQCLLWSKDYWAGQAKKAQITTMQTKDRLSDTQQRADGLEPFFFYSQFLNTVAQAYSRLFGGKAHVCDVKNFAECPFMGQREGLLRQGTLASTFITILHKAALYSLLDRHPLDSGLLHEEYTDVYGIDLTDFPDFENSLKDGRFAKLYENVLKRAAQLAGTPQNP